MQVSAPEFVQLLSRRDPGAQAEVDEFDVASGIHQDVSRLQV